MGAACFKANSTSDLRSSSGGSRRRRGRAPSSDGVRGHSRGDEEDRVPSMDARYLPPLPRNLEKMSPASIRSTCTIDDLVAYTVQGVNNLHDIPTREPPVYMLRLHEVAEVESGWLAVLLSLVECVPIDEAVGTAVIMIIINDCSLPNKVAINRLIKLLNLGSKAPNKLNGTSSGKWRNVCTVLGCVADKLAGPNAQALMSDDVIQFLLSCLEPKVNYETMIHALVAIEKIAKTAKNKQKFDSLQIANQLLRLEPLYKHKDFMAQQVGFCAQWLLDNVFFKSGRPFTYELVMKEYESAETAQLEEMGDSDSSRTMSGVILNDSDVSEYLKISPDGLTARCDAYSFESVRSTAHVDAGAWYYEVQVVTSGIMQIGWATRNSRFSNHDGFGVGDDELSCAYDGCRQYIWHNANTTRHSHPSWRTGDIVGFLIDIDNEELVFSLNGCELKPEKEIFKHIIQKRMLEDLERETTTHGGAFASAAGDGSRKGASSSGAGLDICFICYSNLANAIVLPCQHSGVCMICAMQLEQCCVCRATIERREEVDPAEATQRKQSSVAQPANQIAAEDSANTDNSILTNNRLSSSSSRPPTNGNLSNRSSSQNPTEVCIA